MKVSKQVTGNTGEIEHVSNCYLGINTNNLLLD